MEQIPPDFITKILLLLSLKTLLRLRCVSKSLCSIIDSPDFINLHLLCSRTHPKIIIRHRSRHHRINPAPVHGFDIDGPFDGPPKFQIWHRNYLNCFFAHCNGLAVLDEDDCGLNNLVVWNPSIRKRKKLLLLPNQAKYLLDKGVCFGYDSSIDDYKVMVMKETNRREPRNHIWILGLRSGNWRRIELPHGFRNCYINNFKNFFLDGAFYFISHDVILAFDLAKETFSQVFAPDLGKIQRLPNLVVLEGRLCLRYFSHGHVELYARKKNDDGKFSWSKVFSIKIQNLKYSSRTFLILMRSEVLVFSKDRYKIYFLYNQNYLYAYDFKENKIEMVVAGDKDTEKAFACTESLVWVKNNNNKRKRKKQTNNSGTSLGIE